MSLYNVVMWWLVVVIVLIHNCTCQFSINDMVTAYSVGIRYINILTKLSWKPYNNQLYKACNPGAEQYNRISANNHVWTASTTTATTSLQC